MVAAAALATRQTQRHMLDNLHPENLRRLQAYRAEPLDFGNPRLQRYGAPQGTTWQRANGAQLNTAQRNGGLVLRKPRTCTCHRRFTHTLLRAGRARIHLRARTRNLADARSAMGTRQPEHAGHARQTPAGSEAVGAAGPTRPGLTQPGHLRPARGRAVRERSRYPAPGHRSDLVGSGPSVSATISAWARRVACGSDVAISGMRWARIWCKVRRGMGATRYSPSWCHTWDARSIQAGAVPLSCSAGEAGRQSS